MAIMADRIPDVRFTVMDINPQRIAQWNSDALPIFEPGLQEVVERARGRNLFFLDFDPAHISDAELIFVSVNTPTKEFGEGAGMAADVQYLEKCARDILEHARGNTIVVEKSTVPVKTAEALASILTSRKDDRTFQILSNPEFLAEGTAVTDLENPDRVLIGHETTPAGEAAAEVLAGLYGRWVPRERILLTRVWSSELSKLTANAMLAQRVSSINAISALCEKTDADVGEIARAIGADSRIGPKFLQAGVGFGGSCFRKDILNLSYICAQYGLHEVSDYWKRVVEMNEYQGTRFARTVVERMFNTVAGKKIAVFGFAFKPDTNDTRDSPAIQVCRMLLEEKAHLAITDPKALDEAKHDLRGIDQHVSYVEDPYAAAEKADAIVLLTHWDQFAHLDYQRIFDKMNKPAFLFDGRRQLNAEQMFEIGFNVFTIGRSSLSHL